MLIFAPDEDVGSVSKNSIFQREITPRFRVKRFGDRASTMALLARFWSDFSLKVEDILVAKSVSNFDPISKPKAGLPSY